MGRAACRGRSGRIELPQLPQLPEHCLNSVYDVLGGIASASSHQHRRSSFDDDCSEAAGKNWVWVAHILISPARAPARMSRGTLFVVPCRGQAGHGVRQCHTRAHVE